MHSGHCTEKGQKDANLRTLFIVKLCIKKKKLCTGTEQQIIKTACVKRCNIQWGMNWTLLAHIMKDWIYMCVLKYGWYIHTYINNYGVKKGFERQRKTKISYSDSHTLGHYIINANKNMKKCKEL